MWNRYWNEVCASLWYSFYGWSRRKNVENFWKKPTIWWSYIDDIFFIWEHDEESLRVFIDQVNLFHPTIKFAAEYSKEEVNFLDLNIKLIDGELKTDLFAKPTDTHQFLDPTSSRPYHCKKGIPYSQALTGLIGSAQIMRILINVATIWING